MSITSMEIQELQSYHYALYLDVEDKCAVCSEALSEKLHIAKAMSMSLFSICEKTNELVKWCTSEEGEYFDTILGKSSEDAHRYRVSKVKKHRTHCLLVAMDINDLSPVVPHDDFMFHNRYLTNTVPCGIFKAALDDDMTILYSNQFFCETFHYANATSLKNLKQIIYSEQYESIRSDLRNQYKAQQMQPYYELENRCVCSDGPIIWVLTRYTFGKDYIYGAVFDVTQRKIMEENLRISEQEYRIAMRQAKNTMLRFHIPTRTLTMGNPDDRVLGKYTEVRDVPECVRDTNLVERDSLDEYLAFYYDMIRGKPEGEAMFRMKIHHKSTYSWVKATYILTYDEHHEPATSIISYQDYTKEHDQQIAYQRWIQMFETQKVDSIAYYEYDITNDQLETMENSVSSEVPYKERHSFTYVAKYAASHFVFSKDKELYLNVFNREHLLACFYEKQYEITCEHRRYDESGNIYWARGEIQLIEDPYANTIKAFVLIRNIQKSKEKELQMQRELESDPLTGLYNRKSIASKISELLEDQGDMLHAMIMLDLDRFKLLNDQLGHLRGDEALCHVAKLLQENLRKDDLCARIGGDEYIVFLRNIQSFDALERKLQELKEALNICVENIHISASLGASIYPMHGGEFSVLYQKADQAMYDSKHKGRNCYHIYGSEEV